MKNILKETINQCDDSGNNDNNQPEATKQQQQAAAEKTGATTGKSGNKATTSGGERSSDGRVGNKAVSGNSDCKGIIPKRKQSTSGDKTSKVTGGEKNCCSN